MGVDPLSLWYRAAREPAGLVSSDVIALHNGLARVGRYRSVHAKRAPLPPFDRDSLRQSDLRALGFGPDPIKARLAADDRAILRALLEDLYRGDRAPDEPWIERQALWSLGYVRDHDESEFWAKLVARSGAGDDFASERRAWALAALAWRAAIEPDGPSEEALRRAMSHKRADVRATAAVYLLAAHRLSHRAAPMATVSALYKLCNDDPALEPRAVARVLLEVDRIEVGWDPDDVVFVLSASRVEEPRGPLGLASVRAVQTLAHLDSIVRSLRRASAAEPFVVALAGSVKGARFELCASEGLGRRPGDVAMGTIGLRVGDQLRHVTVASETAVTVRAIERRALDERVEWRGLRAPLVLIETQVNGTRFHRANEALAYLEKGDLLVLNRERDNAHDERAVEVITARGDKLGYVPRGRNRVLAALMDAGERASATVLTAGIEREQPLIWARVTVEPR